MDHDKYPPFRPPIHTIHYIIIYNRVQCCGSRPIFDPNRDLASHLDTDPDPLLSEDKKKLNHVFPYRLRSCL